MASTDVLTRYAELEAAAEDKRRARLRRQPLVLIALTAVLIVAVGLVASVDLRRLRTPQGVALRWTQAAVFGGCDDYLHFSTGTLDRPRADVCRSLRAATQDARQNNLQIGLVVKEVSTRGSSSTVVLQISRENEVRRAELHLRRLDGRWQVLRDDVSCAVVGCA